MRDSEASHILTPKESTSRLHLLQKGLMLPGFLLPETTIQSNGNGSALEVSGGAALILLTLGIEEVREQQSLQLAIYGSADGNTWSGEPLVEFPQKFYAGVSAVLVDLSRYGGVGFLRAEWKVDRWGRGDKLPMFRVYLFAEGLAKNT
jgi:hypothetical protein